MKLTYLILSVAACCNTLYTVSAQDNYSLWPRRPEELGRARELMAQQKWGEAVHLLLPFVHDIGALGCETRAIVGRINSVRYLSRMHPHSAVYTVRKGDNLPRVASLTKCPTDLLMVYNGLVEPSALKIGQKLVYIDASLRVEIYVSLNEITVWDGDILVASYKMISLKGDIPDIQQESETNIVSRESYIQGKRIADNAVQSVLADKVIRFADGFAICSQERKEKKALHLSQKDINEFSFLVKPGCIVLWR